MAGQQPTTFLYVNGTYNLPCDNLLGLMKVADKMRVRGMTNDPRFIILLRIIKNQLLQSSQRLTSQELTRKQMSQIKTQIIAFKHLTKSLPVPEAISNCIIATCSAKPTDNSADKKLVSSVDAITLAKQREFKLKERIDQRIKEIEQIPNLNEDQQLKATIEIKQLRLLDLQRKIREAVIQEVPVINEMDLLKDKQSFSRNRKKAVAAILSNDKYSNELTQAQLRYQKHFEFIESVLKHQKLFKEFHSERIKNQKKLSKNVAAYHRDKQKREQIAEEKKNRELLQALKENDETAYRRLLQEAKNERLKTLLDQTDQYMDTIGVLVETRKAQQDEERGQQEKEEKENKENEQENGKEKEKEKEKIVTPVQPEKPKEIEKAVQGETKSQTKTYYTTAHSIQEEILKQPTTLVGGELKAYQITGLQWLVSLYNNKLNGILADEMGLGKTIQTISLFCHLIENKGDNGPFLVVVPLSTLSNWIIEFQKWAPSVNIVVYKGTPPVRKSLFKEFITTGKFNVCITSFEYVMLDKSDLGKTKWKYIVVDEGHRIKNKESKLSVILRQYHSQNRLLLTGTPLQNDLSELWSLLNFLLPDIFNSSENFEQWFNDPFAYVNKKQTTLAVSEEESLLIINRLHQVLRPFLLRRLKVEVESQLPGKVERVLKCSLSSLQRLMYTNMVEKGVMVTDPNESSKKNVRGFNNTLMQLQKICNHPFLFRDEWDIDENLIRSSGKFELMDRILKKLLAGGHRTLIFSQMTQVMTVMEDYFELRGWNYIRLDGSTKPDERGELVRLWNDPESIYSIFILSTHAGGLGLNLQTADTVILFDTDWNPQMDLQAQDRAHRIGQKKEVYVLRLVTVNSIEEKILERANYKLDLDAKIIQAGMFNTTATDNDRKTLLSQLLTGDNDTDDAELITQDEQINTLLARGSDEYTRFEEMDKELYKINPSATKFENRLMRDDELPEWMTVVEAEYEEDPNDFGRGRRAKSEVDYDDGLSENQFARIVDSGKDLQKVIKQKKQRRASRIANGADPMDDSSSTSESDSSSDDEPTQKRKSRGELSENHILPNKRRKSNSGQTITTPKSSPKPIDSKLKQDCKKVIEKIANFEQDERFLSSIFMKLPSRKDYPDYYQVINSPKSINQIAKSSVRNCQEFKREFQILFQNARIYNAEGSQIYEDANVLEDYFHKVCNEVFEEQPQTQSQPLKITIKAPVPNNDVPPNSGETIEQMEITQE